MTEWPDKMPMGPAMFMHELPQIMPPVWGPAITLTAPKTHEKREQQIVTLRVDQIVGWAYPYEMPYYGSATVGPVSVTATKVFVQNLRPEDGIEVAETPDEILTLIEKAVNPLAAGQD